MSIELNISGNTSSAVAAIDNVNKSLEKMPASAGKAIQAVDGFTSSISNTIKPTQVLQNQVQRLQKLLELPGLNVNQYERLNASLQKTTRLLNLFGGKNSSSAANAATGSLVNLGRVVQDAPFGFLGIANNLNPLLEGFQRLRASSGSTGGALKALGSSLIGAGGIGLAVSIASTALLLFGDKLFGVSKKAKEAKDEVQRVRDVIKSFSGNVEERTSVAGAGTADEISRLNILVTAVKDQTKSYKERNNALDQLKKINQNYFGDLTLEANSLATLTGKVEEYTNALIAAAVVKEFSGDIAKISVESAKQINIYNKLGKEVDDLNKKLAATPKTTFVTQRGDRVETVNQEYVKLTNQINSANKALTTQGNLVSDLSSAALVSKEGLAAAVQESLKFKPLEVKGTKEVKIKVAPRLEFDDSLIGGKKSLLEGTFSDRFSDLPGLIQKFIDGPLVQSVKTADFSKAGETVNLQLFNSFLKQFEAIGAEIPDIDVTISPVINEQKLSRALKFAEKAREQAEQFAGIISNAFTDFFDTIIEGGNAFQALGNIVKSVIAQIIQDLIKAAITALLFRALLPGAGGAVGGLGSLIGSLGRRQAGGPTAANRPFLVGETGPEIFVPSTTGRIIPNNGLHSITGQARQSISVGGEFKIRGRDLELLLARQGGYSLRNT